MPEHEKPLQEHVLFDKNAVREAETQADLKLKDPHGPYVVSRMTTAQSVVDRNRDLIERQIESLEQVRENPFYARLTLEVDCGIGEPEVRTFYLTKANYAGGIQGLGWDLTSWTAPVSKLHGKRLNSTETFSIGPKKFKVTFMVLSGADYGALSPTIRETTYKLPGQPPVHIIDAEQFLAD